jgi:hypothetical protein
MTGVQAVTSALAANAIPTKKTLVFIPSPRLSANRFLTINLDGLAKVTAGNAPLAFTKTRARTPSRPPLKKPFYPNTFARRNALFRRPVYAKLVCGTLRIEAKTRRGSSLFRRFGGA